MHDVANKGAACASDDTLETLRHEFLADAGEEISNLLSYLIEAASGNREVTEVLLDARRVAVLLKGGAANFEMALLGVAAHRFDDYIASLSSNNGRSLGDLESYAETLLDLVKDGEQADESAADLMRRLPAKGSFDADDLIIRDIEVLLVMQAGVATRVIERELHECGYRVTTIHNSFKALELASRTLPELVVISAVMPNLSGIDLALALKTMPATRNISVAVITSLEPGHEKLQYLPETVPVIRKSASFGDDLVEALQAQFLL